MLLQADARRLPIADGVAACCVTSPPYWGLRDYGVSGQIGLEATPLEYLAAIVEVFREVRRVLRDDGTVWVNVGDSYAQGGRGGIGEASTLTGSPVNQNQSRKAARKMRADGRGLDVPEIRGHTDHGLKGKDMIGLPWRVAFALQADGWWLRSDIVWHKPNPMPEAVSDRPTKAHEYLFLLAKSERYYYDAKAIAEPVTGGAHPRGNGGNPKAGKNETTGDRRVEGFNGRWRVKQNASFCAAVSELVDTRNKRTVWTIPTEPYPEAHFATFPTELVKPCILAGSPLGSLVLDPFVGSGTVGRVAEDLGRRWLGCDLSSTYLALARRRTAQLGIFAPARNPRPAAAEAGK